MANAQVFKDGDAVMVTEGDTVLVHGSPKACKAFLEQAASHPPDGMTSEGIAAGLEALQPHLPPEPEPEPAAEESAPV